MGTRLLYKNSLGTYKGDTPREVLLALHVEVLKGWECSLREWKEWNQHLLRERCNVEVSLEETQEAERGFLDAFVEAGILQKEETQGQKVCA